MKSGPLSRYLLTVTRNHRHQFFARSLRDVVVEALLKESEIILAVEGHGDGIGAAPTDDIAGYEHARSHGISTGDRVAYLNQRQQRTEGVAYSRNAVLQV